MHPIGVTEGGRSVDAGAAAPMPEKKVGAGAGDTPPAPPPLPSLANARTKKKVQKSKIGEESCDFENRKKIVNSLLFNHNNLLVFNHENLLVFRSSRKPCVCPPASARRRPPADVQPPASASRRRLIRTEISARHDTARKGWTRKSFRHGRHGTARNGQCFLSALRIFCASQFFGQTLRFVFAHYKQENTFLINFASFSAPTKENWLTLRLYMRFTNKNSF